MEMQMEIAIIDERMNNGMEYGERKEHNNFEHFCKFE
jgi:hypothetical protein